MGPSKQNCILARPKPKKIKATPIYGNQAVVDSKKIWGAEPQINNQLSKPPLSAQKISIESSKPERTFEEICSSWSSGYFQVCDKLEIVLGQIDDCLTNLPEMEIGENRHFELLKDHVQFWNPPFWNVPTTLEQNSEDVEDETDKLCDFSVKAAANFFLCEDAVRILKAEKIKEKFIKSKLFKPKKLS